MYLAYETLSEGLRRLLGGLRAVNVAGKPATLKTREEMQGKRGTGADPERRLPIRIVCEYAWHALFIRHLLRRPRPGEMAGGGGFSLTVVDLPSFRADPARHGCRSETVIACDFSRGLVLIGGTSYAGETKKAVFTYLNFHMPRENVMPMHCSANVGPAGDAAVFFGLSGTGKTTLSADGKRTLLGDDEHGWSDDGIFNFEGGCYAKTIRLSREAEPQIWAAANRFGAVSLPPFR